MHGIELQHSLQAGVVAIPVSVWWLPLDSYNIKCLEVLDSVERSRTLAYHRREDRQRFALAAAALRRIAASRHGEDASAVQVDRRCPSCGGPHGAPRVVGSPLRFSVTHSGDLVGVAVAERVAIGLDVEWQCYDAFDDSVVEHAWSASEPGPVSSAEFYRIWTRKESVVKATGDGLRANLSTVVVTAPAEAPAVVSYAGRSLKCTLIDLQPRADHPAALCVLAPGRVEVTEYHWFAPRPRR